MLAKQDLQLNKNGEYWFEIPLETKNGLECCLVGAIFKQKNNSNRYNYEVEIQTSGGIIYSQGRYQGYITIDECLEDININELDIDTYEDDLLYQMQCNS